jgi:flagellar hook assembly protein FlgD
VEFKPGNLENGKYRLQVQTVDASGNVSGSMTYAVTFEVVNESKISNFYPYPNPFSSSTRFVFTLTGGKVPENIKIQVMTVSGRVVREITKSELGPIKLGNNITSFAWDGTDEFGDRLANGVYLYRVITEMDGAAMNRFETAADNTFKNGIGKMYIMR